jgi:hypothetical protein
MAGSSNSFAANDRSYDSFDMSDSLGTQFAGLNVNNPVQQPNPMMSPAKFNNPYVIHTPTVVDDRKITGSGFYKLDANDFDTYAFDEFELEDDL